MTDKENFNWISIPLIIATPGDIREFVRIGSRRLFIDYPNEAYMKFLKNAISSIRVLRRFKGYYAVGIGKRRKFFVGSTPTEAFINAVYKGLLALREYYNKYLEKNGIDWFKITVARAPKWCKSKFILGYRVNYRKFREFVDKISNGELWSGELSKIYDYINGSKYVIFENTNYVYLEQLTKQVHIMVLPELGQAKRFLLELENEFYRVREDVRKLMKGAIKGARGFYFLLSRIFHVLRGIEIILGNIKQHLDTPPMVYRELRTVLEHLARLYFELNMLDRDLRSCQELKCDHSILSELIEFVTIVDSYWDHGEYYSYTMKVGAYVTSLDGIVDRAVMKELMRELQALIPVIREKKNELRETIKRNLSWSILLTIGSLRKLRKDKNIQHNYKKLSSSFLINAYIHSIVPLSAYTLLSGLQKIFQVEENFLKHLSEVKRIIDEITDKLVEKYSYIPPYPSPKFLMKYIDYLLDSQPNNSQYDMIYNNYSYFVHSYVNSIEYYPFLSIIEYKVLVNELKKYSDIVKQLLSPVRDIVKTLQRIIRSS